MKIQVKIRPNVFAPAHSPQHRGVDVGEGGGRQGGSLGLGGVALAVHRRLGPGQQRENLRHNIYIDI